MGGCMQLARLFLKEGTDGNLSLKDMCENRLMT